MANVLVIMAFQAAHDKVDAARAHDAMCQLHNEYGQSPRDNDDDIDATRNCLKAQAGSVHQTKSVLTVAGL